MKTTAQGIKYEYNTCDQSAAEYTVTHLEETLKNVFTASLVENFFGVEDEDDDDGKMSAASTSDSKSDSGEEEQWVTFEGFHFRKSPPKWSLRERE